MMRVGRTLASIAFVLLLGGTASGSEPPHALWWGTYDVGGRSAFPGTDPDLTSSPEATAESYSYMRGRDLYTLRYTHCHQDWCPGLLACEEEVTAGDLAALYGRAKRSTRGILSASAGLAVTSGIRRDGAGAPGEKYYNVGVPVQVDAFWTPLGFIGVGVEGLANLNATRSFAAALVCARFGRLR